jgi:predicted AAA+ superfamily ATPase
MREKGVDQLILYNELANEALVRKTCALFQGFSLHDALFAPVAEKVNTLRDYYEARRRLIEVSGWQNYIAGLVASADNAFSRMAERGEYDEPIFALAAEELRVIRYIYAFDFAALAGAVESATHIRSGSESIADWKAPAGAADVAEGNTGGKGAHADALARRRCRIHEALAAQTEYESVKALADYYRSYGSGAFAESAAFSWDGALVPVFYDESVTMDSLIGYERQKTLLIENTELLLGGLPASNVLLYGDSGTGKSSSVKALLNMYAEDGLKLVSIPKSRLVEITSLIDMIVGRGLKFIIFIDDLSFDEGENGYKAFKSAIEGRIGATKSNWLVCVTSNRRNIVKEVWKDRETQDDVHLRDNLQEKKSLADRFGLTIIYEAPDKKEYLAIVRGLAAKAGLKLSEGALDEAALTWEIRRGGRSGRAAKDFVDYHYALEYKDSRSNKQHG